ncbi:synaptojanin-1-like [Amphibalanus amphitrite]|uniref:synaptojanin-1-like n=1 Tax=Amphibalanus amphitrite TaxID=1232801 RepID=UPI001C90854B|nr:synaptojanin-1-like [Amphibalanus amphitrite]
MAMGKGFKISHKLNPPNAYSVLMEQKSKAEAVLFESQAVALLESEEVDAIKKQYTKLIDAYGCLGVLQLSLNDQYCLLYLAVVTGCTSVGKICGSEVFKVTQTALISLQGTPGDEDRVTEVKKILNAGTLYFSWSASGDPLDLTLCEQRRRRTSVTDNRFFWNKQLHLHMQRFGVSCDQWLLRVTCGSLEIRTVYVGATQGRAAIISRLSAERAGTRFNVRGTNDDGHVANFVETEQVIYMDDEVASHLQVRGSVPLFWDQPGVQVGSHKVRLTRGDQASAPAFNRHLRQLKRRYGQQVILNLLSCSLVGSRGDEAMLSNLFQAHHKALREHDDVQHVLFDYHAQVRGNNTKALETLKRNLQPTLRHQGFFFARGDEVYIDQCGTVRTNCLDCLDRTNCVQTLVGLEVLLEQLRYLNLQEKASVVSRFQQIFRDMWVNNGNEISKLYAGTGALQGGSKLMDGARSVSRTIQNNLLDSSKQEAIDVILLGSSMNSELADRARLLLPPNMLYAQANLLRAMCMSQDEYTSPRTLRVCVGTYNVNGGKHFRSVAYKNQNLADWLLDAPRIARGRELVDDSEEEPPVDIFAVGFEEIVDLNASNIMAASSENARLWGEELQKVVSRDRPYVPLTSVQLVGVALFVFIRPELAEHVRDVATDTVKTGLGGATGNKGAAAIRMVVYNSSLCFICSHFAAGQKEVLERNADYAEISKKICFPMNRTVFSHDLVFWCGDFNYRIDLPRDEVKELIARRDWATLLEADQLKVQQADGKCFQNFLEGDLAFPPTYKYDLFSDDYDTGEKCRCPAWTDRVLLWKRRIASQAAAADWTPGRVLHYGCAGLKQSDHRPVVALLEVEARQVDPARRHATFERLVQQAGPPDASVILTSDTEDLYSLTELDNFMAELLAQLTSFGDVILVRFVGDTMWVTFKEGGFALAASHQGSVQVQGHRIAIRLRTPDWTAQVTEELRLGEDNTLPLSEHQGSPPPGSPPASPVTETEIEVQSAAAVWAAASASGVLKPQRPPQPTRPPPPAYAATQSVAPEPVIEVRQEVTVARAAPPRPAAVPSRPPPPPPVGARPAAQPVRQEEPERSEGPDPAPPADPWAESESAAVPAESADPGKPADPWAAAGPLADPWGSADQPTQPTSAASSPWTAASSVSWEDDVFSGSQTPAGPSVPAVPPPVPSRDAAPPAVPSREGAPPVVPAREGAPPAVPARDAAPRAGPARETGAPPTIPARAGAPPPIPSRETAPRPPVPSRESASAPPVPSRAGAPPPIPKRNG